MREYTNRGVCVVTAIHDLSLASRYADKLILLKEGHVISSGPPQDVLVSKNIKTSYGISALVYNDPLTGKTTLSTSDDSGVSVDVQSQSLVHVICGGGTGGRLVHSLIDAGINVTAGPLGSGDTDRMVMDILGVNYIPTMAFAPIDLDLSHSHSQMVEAAELVILCDMPIGPNNMKNLEVAKLAKQLVIFGQPELGDRDLTDGSASLLYQELKPIYMNSDLDSIVQKAGEIIRKTK
jgi:iron complex transport system ATP-binding protein